MLALPAAVWAGAALETAFVDCDIDCGDRARGWFFAAVVTAPLLPLGGWLVAGGTHGPLLVRLGRAACLLIAGGFGLLGVGLLAAATGLTEAGDDAGASFAPAGAWCLAVAWGMLAVRRRLSRRYPSGEWRPSAK